MSDAFAGFPPDDLWAGHLVRLRAIEVEDAEAFHSYDRDTTGQRLGSGVKVPRSLAATRKWAEEASKREDGKSFSLAIARLSDDLAVGSISVNREDRQNRVMHYGIGLGRSHWRKGYGREAVLLLLRYYFEELDFVRVECGVFEFNPGSLDFHRSLGFVEEGVRRKAFLSGGQWWDDTEMGMLAGEFRARYPELLWKPPTGA